MTREDTREPRLKSTNEALRLIQAELRASQRQLKRVLDVVEQQQRRIAQLESSVARLDRIQMEMLTGRVWRTLRAAGQLAKRFVPRLNASQKESVALSSDQQSFLVCDEPRPNDPSLRRGSITVPQRLVAVAGGEDGVARCGQSLRPLRGD